MYALLEWVVVVMFSTEDLLLPVSLVFNVEECGIRMVSL